jgi:DNA-binding NarL/FixJ family response regulator
VDRLGFPGVGDEMTPAEERVAELLSSGMTVRDAARALLISPKTVEAHLTRLYRKLGIHSRAELGRLMGDRAKGSAQQRRRP